MSIRRLALPASALVVLAAAAVVSTPGSASTTTAGTWTATASMSTPRAHLTATPLASGRVLVVGGVGETTTELYDPPPVRGSPAAR